MAYKNYLGRKDADMTRGIRNNNPGNLQQTTIPWEGKVPLSKNTDSRFEQFIELRYGIRAKMRDIITDITKGKNTITKLISEFAPDFENDTASYIANVARITGISATSVITTLTEESLISICKAISTIENGKASTKYITDQDYQDALAILGSTAIKIEKKKTVK